MITHFHINYGTVLGEQIVIRLQRKGIEENIICQTYDGVNWNGTVQLDANETIFYKYILQSYKGMLEEYGTDRKFYTGKSKKQLFVQDAWRPPYDERNAFFSAAFQDVIFKRNENDVKKLKNKEKSSNIETNALTFQLHAANIPRDCIVGVVGNHLLLGNWQKPILLSSEHYPTWTATVQTPESDVKVEYKFVLCDAKTGEIKQWEQGDNRKLFFSFPSFAGNALVHTDEFFNYTDSRWHGAGIATPVFALRSQKGLGIGEFTDLNLLIDWAAATKMKVVQVLPVNDTIASKTWIDSYPYAAISVFALHPLYINIQKIATLENKSEQKSLEKAIFELNALEVVDFEQVLQHKFSFFKKLYQQEKERFFKNTNVKQFLADNAYWLKSYAVFCYLRDQNGTSNFNLWKNHNIFSEKIITELANEKTAHFDDVALYYFIQYHAHQQLFGATEYARSQGVILKGDLPIGIYRYSCDAWVAPQLYNMNGQAGAPPDAYAEAGQNWGFPTYNWEVMSQDGFAWWRGRMTKLAEYFDALRIDHILGFFRIWQIPINQVEGTLGLFNPRLPYSRLELGNEGLHGNLERFTKPYIRVHHLMEIFGSDVDFVKENFLQTSDNDYFLPTEIIDNQQKIKALFIENKKYSTKKHLEKPLMKLLGEVLLIEEPNSNGLSFNPRITLHTTRSYKELEQFQQYIFDRLYDDYFFKRHDEFWKQQALWKLPALLKATNMLICGEDLGMIPNSVPDVMRELNIIALEIQRMPKGNATFGDTEKYPYMTVCSPSCHDMSTVRGWWEADAELTQRFWQENLKQQGNAPSDCSPEIVEAINKQHFQAPSMWAIFPLQDLIGMDESLRRKDAKAEQINEPSNPQHYWRFRLHLSIEQLLDAKKLNEKIVTMVEESGR